MMHPPREPRTKGEWQMVVNLARAMALVHSARCYGLITGGPEINVERMEDLLARGAARGIEPQSEKVDGWIRAMAGLDGADLDT